MSTITIHVGLHCFINVDWFILVMIEFFLNTHFKYFYTLNIEMKKVKETLCKKKKKQITWGSDVARGYGSFNGTVLAHLN